MSDYAREVLRRREAAINALPVTGKQTGLGGLLGGLGRAAALSYAGPQGLSLLDALVARAKGGPPLDPMQFPPLTGGMRFSKPGQYRIERMSNGLTHVHDRNSGLTGTFRNDTGEYYHGELRFKNLADIPPEPPYTPPTYFTAKDMNSPMLKHPMKSKRLQERAARMNEARGLKPDRHPVAPLLGSERHLLPEPEESTIPLPSYPKGEPERVMEAARTHVEPAHKQVRKLEAELRMLNKEHRQLTNRDVPSTRRMAPVARPPEPRTPTAGELFVKQHRKETDEVMRRLDKIRSSKGRGR